jgi:hypothetical protein
MTANDKKRVIWGMVHNAKNFRKRGEPLWLVVSRMCGVGSTWAKELCLDHGVDPEDTGPDWKRGDR